MVYETHHLCTWKTVLHTHTHTHTHTHQGRETSHLMDTQRNRSRWKRLAVHKTIPSSFIQQVLVMKGLWCDRHRCRCRRQQWDMRMSTLVALCSSGRQKINGDNRQSVRMWKVLRKKKTTLRLSTGLGSVGGKWWSKKDDQERLHWDSDMWAENLQEERRSKFCSSLGKGMPHALKGQDLAKGQIGRGHAQVTPRKSGGQKGGGPSADHVGPQRS